MSDSDLKRIVSVLLIAVLATLAGSFYLIARPLSPTPAPAVPPVQPAAPPIPLPLSPTIIWTPPSLTEQVAIGQTKTLTVSFSSSEAVNNVLVHVVPELQPFVQVTPSLFTTIGSNQTINLNVALSASKTSPLGIFKGTIQLRIGNTLAKPLPITITVCRCVTEQGFSLSFPPEWLLKSDLLASGGAILLNTFDSAYLQGGIIPDGGGEITIVRAPVISTLDDVIADSFPGAEIESTEPASVSGEPATKVRYRIAFAPKLIYRIVVVYVERGTTLYKFFLTYHEGDSLESQFVTGFQSTLDTVKFTE